MANEKAAFVSEPATAPETPYYSLLVVNLYAFNPARRSQLASSGFMGASEPDLLDSKVAHLQGRKAFIVDADD